MTILGGGGVSYEPGTPVGDAAERAVIPQVAIQGYLAHKKTTFPLRTTMGP